MVQLLQRLRLAENSIEIAVEFFALQGLHNDIVFHEFVVTKKRHAKAAGPRTRLGSYLSKGKARIGPGQELTPSGSSRVLQPSPAAAMLPDRR